MKTDKDDRYSRYAYPKDMMDIARRRVAGLLNGFILRVTTLEKLLESAYLQGIVDAAESIPYTSENKRSEEQ